MTDLQQRQAWAEILAERARSEFGIVEPIRVLVTDQGDGPLAGTPLYSNGEWVIVVKGTMGIRKFTDVVLHELAHILGDDQELKEAGQWGDDALWQRLHAVAVVMGDNPWAEQFARSYREHGETERQADRVGRGLGALLAGGG